MKTKPTPNSFLRRRLHCECITCCFVLMSVIPTLLLYDKPYFTPSLCTGLFAAPP
jgi:hypothetical protein